MLALVCLGSGYTAFDAAWSGVGLINRPTLYIMHQTGGVLVPVAVLCLLGARIGEALTGSGGRRMSHASPWRWLLGLFHYLLLTALLATSLLGIGATSCGDHQVHFFGLIDFGLKVPRTICTSSLPVFGYHKWLGGMAALLLSIHVGGALIHAILVRDGVLSSIFNVRFRMRLR